MLPYSCDEYSIQHNARILVNIWVRCHCLLVNVQWISIIILHNILMSELRTCGIYNTPVLHCKSPRRQGEGEIKNKVKGEGRTTAVSHYPSVRIADLHLLSAVPAISCTEYCKQVHAISSLARSGDSSILPEGGQHGDSQNLLLVLVLSSTESRLTGQKLILTVSIDIWR